jgi:hypothetical protein
MALALASQATAQAEPAVYSITGQVLGIDAAPVTNAEVRVAARGGNVLRIVQSDSAGRFSVPQLRDMPVSIRVRAFGYAPRAVAIATSPTTYQATVTIQLESVAAELAGVGVTEAESDQDKKLAAYRDRKATNSFAHFVDGDDIERRKPQFVSEMLRGMAGVTLTASDKLGNLLHLRGCSPLVWVDGVRMAGAQLDEVAPPGDVAGIEVYNSFAGIPSRYFDRSATCGTILVWLRS